MVNDAILHYVYDPMCGWCYAAAPLVQAAREVLPVRAHGGGLMAGPRRRPVTPELRAFVTPHDQRIAQLSGQRFGEAYRDGLLRDTSAVFDSEPPIAAILAAESVAQRGLDMLEKLQQAHYVEGRRVADREVLLALADAMGLDADAFAAALDQALGPVVQRHIAETRAWMAQQGVQGFPSLLLERQGRFTPVEVGSHLGKPQGLAQWLRTQLAA